MQRAFTSSLESRQSFNAEAALSSLSEERIVGNLQIIFTQLHKASKNAKQRNQSIHSAIQDYLTNGIVKMEASPEQYNGILTLFSRVTELLNITLQFPDPNDAPTTPEQHIFPIIDGFNNGWTDSITLGVFEGLPEPHAVQPVSVLEFDNSFQHLSHHKIITTLKTCFDAAAKGYKHYKDYDAKRGKYQANPENYKHPKHQDNKTLNAQLTQQDIDTFNRNLQARDFIYYYMRHQSVNEIQANNKTRPYGYQHQAQMATMAYAVRLMLKALMPRGKNISTEANPATHDAPSIGT